MQEYGFSREFLVSLAVADLSLNGKLATRIKDAAQMLERRCSQTFYEGKPLPYEPEYLSNALLRKLGSYPMSSDERYRGYNTLLEYYLDPETEVNLEVEHTLFESYHPDNRLFRPFQPGVRPDGTIIDAEGTFSRQPGFVDERGKLFDLEFYIRNSDIL